MSQTARRRLCSASVGPLCAASLPERLEIGHDVFDLAAGLKLEPRHRRMAPCARGNPPYRNPQRAPCVASLRAPITSSREMMPTSWRSAPIMGKLRAFRLTINWRTRVNGAPPPGVSSAPRSVGHHLTGGEGERSEKIEFGHDTQHLSFLHDGEGIEIMFLRTALPDRAA